MSHEFKVCPSCLEEYMPVASECGRCGLALVFPDAPELREEPEEFPPVSELRCVRVGPLTWTRALSDSFGLVGIAHRIERDERGRDEGGVDPSEFGGVALYGIWVKPEDLEAAKEVDRSLFAHLERGDAEGPAASEDERCPACQTRLPLNAVECPDCGLSFG